jgi:hypothetical protein
LLVEYVPSLHTAVAPLGAPAGAGTVGICDGVVAAVALAGAPPVVGRGVEVREDARVVADVLLLDEDGVCRVDVAVRFALTRLATPPCAEQRPWVDLAVEYVPSLHLAVAPAGAWPSSSAGINMAAAINTGRRVEWGDMRPPG